MSENPTGFSRGSVNLSNKTSKEDDRFFTGYYGKFALARRAKVPELCFVHQSDNWYFSLHLINSSTDDGDKEPTTYGMEEAYYKAMNEKFVRS